jgi:hypothetical protein
LQCGEDARLAAEVDRMMWGMNIKVEYRKDGQWYQV